MHGPMKHRKATVLVALYKSGSFIENKIVDLSRQTAFKDCHIVLLNCQNLGDERDHYLDFVRSNDNVIEVQFRDYVKLYRSWNFGIWLTQSDYIINSNADDRLHPELFEKLIAALDADRDAGVVMCDSYVTDRPNSIYPDWQWYGDIITGYPGRTAGPCPMWRRELMEITDFPDTYVISDALVWHRWHSQGVKFKRLDLPPMSLYYQAHGQNLETRMTESGELLRDVDLREHGSA